MIRFIATAALAWGTLSAVAKAQPARPAQPDPPASLSMASSTSILEPGSTVLVAWPRDPARVGFDEMELVLSVDGGRTFPVRVTRRIAPADVAYPWSVPSLPAAHARLALRAGLVEEGEAEAIVAISPDFAIAPLWGRGAEELFRVGDEERTRDALEDAPPPRPDSALDGVPSFAAVADPPLATGPEPSPGSQLAPVRSDEDLAAVRIPRVRSQADPSRSLAAIRLPMRL
jgi:hypothetical protein